MASSIQCYICYEDASASFGLKMADKPDLNRGLTGMMAVDDEPSSPLKPISGITCGGCKMQRYCCLNHMNMDRSQHQDVCEILTRLQVNQGIPHPLFILKKKPISSMVELQRTITMLKFVVRAKLNRPLAEREHELLGYPAYCQVCFSFGGLLACSPCGGVAYCSTAHAEADAHKHTPDVCRTLALICSPYRQLGNEKRIRDVAIEWPNPDQVELSLGNSHLVEVFYQLTGILINDHRWKSVPDFDRYVSCSSFSGIASICLALQCVKYVATPQDVFTIYIVGTSDELVERYFHPMHLKFFFLLHKGIYRLHLFFIGSQLNAEEHKSPESVTIDFMGCQRTVVKYFFPMSFKKFACVHTIEPVLIMIFDIDFGDLYGPTAQLMDKMRSANLMQQKNYSAIWEKCIHEILEIYGKPICFTSPTKAMIHSNFSAILELADRYNIKVDRCFIGDVNQNPYREILPKRNEHPEEPEPVVYANNYLEVIVTGLKN